jgi:ArsR family transcriptional regulator, arsenate/arsenite/antimonite-responsive transcriptional repressor
MKVARLYLKVEHSGRLQRRTASSVAAGRSHLAILVRAGLLRSSRNGRTIIYRFSVDGMQALLSFLVNDCCNGHPELCKLPGLAAQATACCAPSPATPSARERTAANGSGKRGR